MLWIRKNLGGLFLLTQMGGIVLFVLGEKLKLTRVMIFGGVICGPTLTVILLLGIFFLFSGISLGLRDSFRFMIRRWQLYFEHFRIN